jgi:hypothetical protein
MAHLFDFSFFYGYSLDIVLLVCSLIFCYHKGNPKYIKVFPIFTFSNILGDTCSALGTYFINNGNKAFSIVFFLLFYLIPLFELIFFTYLFFQLIQSVWAKRIAWAMALLFIILFILFYTSVFNLMNRTSTIAFFETSTLVESISIIMLCLVFFRELLKRPYSKELTKLQSFWLVSGILFYFSLRVPAFLFSGYFGIQKNQQIASAILSVYNYSQVIPYALFIKAITCRVKE